MGKMVIYHDHDYNKQHEMRKNDIPVQSLLWIYNQSPWVIKNKTTEGIKKKKKKIIIRLFT